MTGVRVWLVGGEDSHLRIPFMHGLKARGLAVVALGTGGSAAFEQAGIPYLSYPLNRFFNLVSDLRTLRRLRSLLAEHRPDIVHSFDTKPNLLVPFAVADTGCGRAVRTINGMGYVFSARTPLALGLRPVYRGLQRLAARRTAVTVFQNSVDKLYFENRGLVPPERSRLIPGAGLDIDRFTASLPSPEKRRDLRERLGLAGKTVVTVVSRLTKQKGIPAFLEAAAILAPCHWNVAFLLVGPQQTEGPFAVSARMLARYQACVKVLGPRDDVPALLAMTDVFVLPTTYREGVPRVLLEAGAAKCAIVTTDTPGCTEVVRDGWNGLIVKPGDVKGLANAIEFLLARPQLRQAMGDRSYALVADEFSMDRVVEAHAALYEEVMRT